MLKGGFMLPRQIILVPRTECWEVGLSYQGNSCSCRGRSVGRWLCATKAKHVCFADKLLEIGFVAPNQFVPRTECLKLALRTKPSQVAEDRMLDDGFVAKASSLKPRPSILYLEAQMNGRLVSWVDKELRHSFMSPKLTRELGLADW